MEYFCIDDLQEGSVIREVYVAPIEDFNLTLALPTGSGFPVVDTMPYLTTTTPFIQIPLNQDIPSSYRQVYADTDGVILQTLTLNIGTDIVQTIRELKRKCGLIVLIVMQDGTTYLQGATFVFQGYWLLVPNLDTATITQVEILRTQDPIYTIKIESVASDYSCKVSDYATIIV